MTNARTALTLLTLVAATLLVSPAIVSAQCPPSCPISGGGDGATDCYAEMASPAMHLNSPFFNPAKIKPAKEHRCFDGDPGCDLDGEVDGKCEFDIDLCLYNADPNLPSCTPSDVTAVSIKGSTTKFPAFATLQSAVDALLPATSSVCTSGVSVTLPLKVTGSGAQKVSKMSFKAITTTASGIDKDKTKLSCVPHRWPSVNYNHKNHNGNSAESAITPANVLSLSFKWDFQPSLGTSLKGVTGSPTVGRKLVYIASWDGVVYAVDKKKGKLKWSYDTGASLQSSATLTAEGRLLVVDSLAVVHALDAKKGGLLWTASIGDPDLEAAHGWGSPRVANGRVFVGRSSHGDQPCTQGHMYAFDLDDGTELWRVATVPDFICDDDTTVECTTNADCGGTCVPGIGGGVTTTPSTSSDGETVYFVSVGCFTSPSIGNSDAFFSVDAASGAVNWIHRTQFVEQYADGPPYNDYGFLNGPMLVTVDDGMAGTQDLLVAGSKDGSLYAVDPDTGAPVWTEVVQPAADFAGFGLFNGAIGFEDGDIFAALYQQINEIGGPLDRLWSFSGTDGLSNWSAREDEFTWAHVALANGVLFVGATANVLEVYDAATGTLLNTLGGFSARVVGGASISDGTLYVPYGVTGNTGGVMAFALP